MNSIRSKSGLLRAAIIPAAALMLLPALAGAPDLPSAASLLERHITASGGRAALARSSEGVTTGTLSMPAAGLTGTMTTTSAPNRIHVDIELPGLGNITSGYDGTTAWSNNPMQGARVLEGEERQAVVEGTRPGAMFRDSTVGKSMTTTGQDTISNVACWNVEVSWISGRTTQDCYSVETGLLHASTATQESPMGSATVTTVVSDYKDVDGLKLPTTITQQLGGQVMMTLTDLNVKFGDVPADAFALPAEVKALVGG